jgi:hypothetical protein
MPPLAERSFAYPAITTLTVSVRRCASQVPDNSREVRIKSIISCLLARIWGQHTRVFRYVLQYGLVNQLGKVRVTLADGSESTLAEIRKRAEQGGVGVFFGLAQKQALNQMMQARGHIVVLLSSDRQRQDAERQYLEQFCEAKPFDGMIDCTERYAELTRFERVFLSELELNVSKSYEVHNFRLIAGKLTEEYR